MAWLGLPYQSQARLAIADLSYSGLASTRDHRLPADNLALALPYLRLKDKPRLLWIDAICVDQQNLKERGHQVERCLAEEMKEA